MSNIINTLFSFSGTITRNQFWIGGATVVAAAAVAVGGVFATFNSSDAELAAIVAAALFIFPILAICSKRIRAQGLSQWYLALWLVPMVGMVWSIVILGLRPTPPQSTANT